MYPFAVAASIAFMLVTVFTPLIRSRAQQQGYLDYPDADRKRHHQAKPLGGGIAVFLAVLVTLTVVYLFFAPAEGTSSEDARFLLSLLLASTVILATGILDDLTELSGLEKLIGQLVSIGVFLCLEPSVERLEVFGFEIQLGILSAPFATFWLLCAINSVNLLDGADGLATTVGIIIAAAIAVIAIQLGHTAEAVVAVSVVGALVGFLLFNFPPSSIFLGDAGSMLIGLLVGILAFRCHLKEAATVALIGPLALLSIPILDSAAAVIRRVLTGKNVFTGDHAHLHHVLSRRGLSPKLTVLVVAVLCVIPAAGATASGLTGNSAYTLAGCIVVATILAAFSFFRTESKLLLNRVQRIGGVFFRASTSHDGERPHCLGLEQSPAAEHIWDTLTAFAVERNLGRIRLELEGEWLCDGHDVICDHRVGPTKSPPNWRTRIPLMVRDRQIGAIGLYGTLDAPETRRIHTFTLLLLDEIYPSLEEIEVDRERRSSVQHRALFINRSYWPDCEATGQLLTDLCETVANDLRVTVIAGKPNENPDQLSFVSGGVEKRNGVTIRRVRHSRLPKSSIVLRAMNLISFLVMATCEAIRTPRHDIVVVETDPFPLALLGAELKRWRDCRLVVYVQDVYPDIAVAIGKVRESFFTRTLRKLLVRAYQRADRVIVLGNDMRQRLISHGVDDERIVVIPNWVDTDHIYPDKENNAFRVAHGIDDGRFVIMHSGNMGLTQELEQLIEVADHMRGREDIIFVIVGGGAKKAFLEAEVKKRGLANVLILPYQPSEGLRTSLSAADLHVVSMHPNVSGNLVPSKIYGIMASGTPVLAIVPDDTDVSNLVAEEAIGINVPPGRIDEICRVITDAADGVFDLDQMGLRARKVVESRFDRKISTNKILALLLDTLGSHPTKRAPTQQPASTERTSAL